MAGKVKLTESEIAVLRYSSEPYTSSRATHWFRRHMAKPDATARDAYLHLRKMAASGLMEGVNYGGGKVRWWKITDAGRAALSQPTGSDNE